MSKRHPTLTIDKSGNIPVWIRDDKAYQEGTLSFVNRHLFPLPMEPLNGYFDMEEIYCGVDVRHKYAPRYGLYLINETKTFVSNGVGLL